MAKLYIISELFLSKSFGLFRDLTAKKSRRRQKSRSINDSKQIRWKYA